MKSKVSLLTFGFGSVILLSMLGFVYASLAAQIDRPANPVIFPAANSLEGEFDSPVSISYDEEIDPTTVDGLTFAIQAMGSGLRTESFIVAGGTITLTSPVAYHPGELVQVSATTGTLSLVDGLGPLAPTVWQFRVRVEGGSAFFKDSGQELGETNSLGVALGDLDRDADLDAFVSNCEPSYVWLNDGQGIFIDSGQRLGDLFCSVDVALGDMDGDGDLDAFTVSSGTIDFGKVWFNDGSGYFSESGQNLGDSLGSGIALGDLDGDGDLDAFYVRKGPGKVLLNDGGGIFADSGQNIGNWVSTDVGLGDLDGDGDLDAYIANTEGGSLSDRILFNDGTGKLTDSGQSLSQSPVNSVGLGDLDGDGDVDAYLAVTRPQGSELGPDEVWFNDGSGTLTDSGQRLGVASSNQVVLSDLDGDGDLDAFVANLVLPNQVWRNMGNGSFLLTKQFLGNSSNPYLELGDLDEDGDIDAFLTDFGNPATIWRNQDEVNFLFAPMVSKH